MNKPAFTPGCLYDRWIELQTKRNQVLKKARGENEKPILFSTPMVQAILDGRKTMTRRVVDVDISNQFDIDRDGTVIAYIDQATGDSFEPAEVCKYQVGDILLVRETTYLYGYWIKNGLTKTGKQKWKYIWDKTKPVYYADCKPSDVKTKKDQVGYFKRPSIFMPRAAARIFLRVTNVRVERLQDITEDDATMEGLTPKVSYGSVVSTARGSFHALWDSIYKMREDGWDINPWVWVIEFEKMGGHEHEGRSS